MALLPPTPGDYAPFSRPALLPPLSRPGPVPSILIDNPVVSGPSLEQLEALWEVPQEEPEEPIFYRRDVLLLPSADVLGPVDFTPQPLATFEAVRTLLLTLREEGFILVGDLKHSWYVQAARLEGLFLVEGCSSTSTSPVVLQRFKHAEGPLFTLAAAYGMVVEFCKHRRVLGQASTPLYF